MKELSIEEKARRYDEAIVKGRQIQNTPYTAHWDTMKEVVEHLIPELKESEDERIRKHLVDCLKFSLKGAEEQDAAGCSRQKDIEAYKWGIAYLEKQGKEEFNEASYRTGIKRVLDNPESSWLEEQGSQNLANSAKTCKVGQNPAWSGEDEKTTQRIVDTIMKYAISPHGIINGDKPNFEYAKEFESWLKSLKFRIQPQWKPSDEQMEALDDFIYAKYPNIEKHGAAVKSLYQDLKNLKG